MLVSVRLRLATASKSLVITSSHALTGEILSAVRKCAAIVAQAAGGRDLGLHLSVSRRRRIPLLKERLDKARLRLVKIKAITKLVREYQEELARVMLDQGKRGSAGMIKAGKLPNFAK